MILLVFKDGSSTQFCCFEAENIAKLLQAPPPAKAFYPATAAACHTTVAAPRGFASQEAEAGVAGAVHDIGAVGGARTPFTLAHKLCDTFGSCLVPLSAVHATAAHGMLFGASAAARQQVFSLFRETAWLTSHLRHLLLPTAAVTGLRSGLLGEAPTTRRRARWPQRRSLAFARTRQRSCRASWVAQAPATPFAPRFWQWQLLSSISSGCATCTGTWPCLTLPPTHRCSSASCTSLVGFL